MRVSLVLRSCTRLHWQFLLLECRSDTKSSRADAKTAKGVTVKAAAQASHQNQETSVAEGISSCWVSVSIKMCLHLDEA